MAKWTIEYYDEQAEDFIEFTGYNLNEIYEELSEVGEPHLYFYVFNTAPNRALLQQDLLINAYYDDVLQFSGILQGGDIEDRPGKIKMVVYDDFIITLDQASSFTGAYEKPAKDIIDAILSGTGYSAHSSTPTTIIPVIFYHANRLDAIKFMQKALACDVWHNGTIVYFGAKGAGVTNTPTTIALSKRGIDRSKGQFTKVEIRGTDVTGFHILGVVGSGTKVWKGNEDQMTDETTLNAIATKKLAELATDSSGMPVSVLMTEGKDYALGESVAVSDARYLLDGTYRIMQMTKTKFKCNMQLDRARKTIAATVDELKGWEKKGIYIPGSEAWVINLQGLVGLFHLNEGEGTVAKNRAPVDTPINGTINNCSWENGPVTKMLTFNGTSAVVDLGATSQAGLNFTDKLSVGAWFSPSANDSTLRRVVNKSLQFDLQYHVNTGVLTFQLYTGGQWHVFNSDAGLIKVGGRIFAMVTYDRQKVRMYYNGWLHKEWSETGAPASATGTVYLGSALKGVLAEVMLWSRALVDQEVLELYFFPLFRVNSGGGGGGSYSSGNWYVAVGTDSRYGLTSPSGMQTVPVGQDLVLTASKTDFNTFRKWLIDAGLDSEIESEDNPYIFAAQAGGTVHTAYALFVSGIPVTNGIPLDISTIIDARILVAGSGARPIGVGISFIKDISLSHTQSILTDTGLTLVKSISLTNSVSASAADKWTVDCSGAEQGSFTPAGIQAVDADKLVDLEIETMSSYASIQALHPSASASISAVGQSFKGNGAALVSASFMLLKTGSPVGNLRAALYAHSGTYGTSSVPTGALIEDSADIAMAGIATAGYVWVTFTFSGATTLTAGTNYCIVLYAKTVTTLNSSNYIRAAYKTSGMQLGNYFKYSSSAWSATSTYDLLFVLSSSSAGTTLAVSAVPNFSHGWVFPTTNPLSLDGTDCGTVAGDGALASYTIPEQIATTHHKIVLQSVYGWGFIGSGVNPSGYLSVNSGSGKTVSSSGSAGTGYHWHIWLDGVIDLGHSTATVPVQTNGTVHTVTEVATPN